jgi:hypothetical protein
MIKVNKPINLKQLDIELNDLGLIATVNENKEIIEVGLAENNTATEVELKAAVDAHIAIDEVAAKAQAKAELLERLGITADEAKLLLA